MRNFLLKEPVLKRSWMKAALGASIIAGLLMGCDKSKSKENPPETPQAKIIDTATLIDAESLANAGEQLMSPYSFMYAYRVFELALQKDPNNKKAQFYKSFLEAPMSLQGILTRIRPLVKSRKQLAGLDSFIAESPVSPLKSFLVDIKDPKTQFEITESNYQDFFVAYRNHLNTWRAFLKQNHDLKLTLNLNPETYKEPITERTKSACVPEKIGETSYKIECDFTKILQVEVGEADIVALQQYVSGILFYYSVPTSYDWGTITQLSKEKRYKNLPPATLIGLIHNLESFAPLRKDNSLSLLQELGSDFVGAMHWAMSQQTQLDLCQDGKQEGVRKGYLFENGLCLKETPDHAVEKILVLIESVFQGPTSVTLSTDRGMYTTLLDFSKWKTAPPQDLRIFVPTQLNACGRPSQFLDQTFAGILPNQDWYNLMETTCK